MKLYNDLQWRMLQITLSLVFVLNGLPLIHDDFLSFEPMLPKQLNPMKYATVLNTSHSFFTLVSQC